LECNLATKDSGRAQLPYQKTNIKDVFLFTPQVFEDSRGHFFESFRQDKTLEETGFNFEVKQFNTSLSKRGVLRGIHFKKNPPGQAKFVSVSQGMILDLAIDLRKSSKTFGEWQAFELSNDNNQSLLLGYGIGHAFLALEDNTKVSYLCDSVFEPDIEFGINPLKAGIDWQELAKPFGLSEFVVNEKDSLAPGLKDAQHLLFI
jgi:dTDP-4-dehydrorhamnose 3,5-epimerase